MNAIIGRLAPRYGLPWRTTASQSSSKVFDAQSGYESAVAYMSGASAGANRLCARPSSVYELVALNRPALIDPRIATLDRWIEDNISRRFKACDLAPTVGLSVRQLERLFLRHLDRTPAEHLEHKRLSLALTLTLMRQTNLGVDGIARSTGHRCLATFRRKFRRKFGTSPVLT